MNISGWNQLSKKQKNLRRHFKKQNGICFYCGRPVSLPVPHQANGYNRNATASLEHLFSKYDIRHLIDPDKTVMACMMCNHYRARMENEAIYNSGNYKFGEYTPYALDNTNILLRLFNNEIDSFII